MDKVLAAVVFNGYMDVKKNVKIRTNELSNIELTLWIYTKLKVTSRQFMKSILLISPNHQLGKGTKGIQIAYKYTMKALV